MPAKAIVFDLDGTLVDTAPDLMAATNHVLAAMGVAPDMARGAIRVSLGWNSRDEDVEAFLAASRDGDFTRLLDALDPEVTLRSDGGTSRPGLLTLIHGAAAVATSALTFRRAAATATRTLVNGLPGGVAWLPDGRPFAVLAFTVAQWGWRYGAFIAGIGLIITGVPVALYVKRSPESMGLLPDGASPTSEQERQAPNNGAATAEPEREFNLKQAMKSAAFWKLILATTTRVGVFNSITVHFVPIMVWRGASEAKAAALLATLALMSLPSHLFVGWIADRVNKPRLMAACMLIGAGAVAILAYGDGEWALWTFTILFTFVEALFPVSWATVGDYFGRKHFATIRGSMSFFYLWGPALGPVVTGYVYDRHQSYAPLMNAYIAIALVAGLLYASLRQPKLPA